MFPKLGLGLGLLPLQVFGSPKMWQQFARSYRALNFALLRMNSAFLQITPPKSAFRTLLLKHVANKTFEKGNSLFRKNLAKFGGTENFAK